MPFTNKMNQRSGPTKRWAWSSIHIVWYPASVFAENCLYCFGLLELCGYINFVHFTNCPRTFGGHCIYMYSNIFLFSISLQETVNKPSGNSSTEKDKQASVSRNLDIKAPKSQPNMSKASSFKGFLSSDSDSSDFEDARDGPPKLILQVGLELKLSSR